MSATSHPAVPRLNLLWFTVLAAPMMIGIAIALMIGFGQYQAPMELVPTDPASLSPASAGARLAWRTCPTPHSPWQHSSCK